MKIIFGLYETCHIDQQRSLEAGNLLRICFTRQVLKPSPVAQGGTFSFALKYVVCNMPGICFLYDLNKLTTMDKTNNWTYKEIHAFIMLYAANVDGKITQEEENLIVKNLQRESYERVKQVFQKCDDTQALDLILSYRDQYFATPEDKAKILADMVEIYKADAVFEQIERGMHKMFQRLI